MKYKCVYVVMATVGTYSDRTTYEVCAYLNYDSALKKAERCQRLNDKLMRDIKNDTVSAYDVDRESHPKYYKEDDIMYQFEPTTYSVRAVRLEE